jgi:hypothetical protein
MKLLGTIRVGFKGWSISKVPLAIQIKWQVVTTLNVAHLFHWSIIIFQHNLQAHWCICSILARVQKFCCIRNQAPAFTTILNSHSSLLWNRQPPKCCFRGPNKLKSDGARLGLQSGQYRRSLLNTNIIG